MCPIVRAPAVDFEERVVLPLVKLLHQLVVARHEAPATIAGVVLGRLVRRRVGLEQRRFSGHDFPEAREVPSASGGVQEGGGAVSFVHPQVGAVIGLLRQREAVLRERLLKGEEVRGLIVGEHPVEVKNDGAKGDGGHGPPPWPTLL